MVNRLDDTDSRGIRIKPETEDVKSSVYIDEYVNGLHKSYQLYGEHNLTHGTASLEAGVSPLGKGCIYLKTK
jgi:hypothetical protein